ncbi:MAG: trigger factor [Elusimicrobiales bacterium]|nr:trigger factor [Elusimicrobiales bacterium]
MTPSATGAAETIQVKRLSQKGCAIQLSADAPAEFVHSAFQDALVQVQVRAQVPGFRKGKVPLAMVRDNFAGMIKERAFENVVRFALAKALESEKLHPVDSPSLLKREFEEGKPLHLEFEVEVPPSVTPKNYTKIPLLSRKNPVTDEKISAAIKEILDQNARLEPEADGAALTENHFAVVDYEAWRPGADKPAHTAQGELVDLSSDQTVKGLVEAIKGAKKGETREFETETAGAKFRFKVTVGEIKKKSLPDVNDAFAKEMGFESEAKFREHVKNALERQAEEDSRRETLRQMEDHLIKENAVDLPQSLVNHHIGLSLERLMDRMLPEEREKMNKEQLEKLGEKLRPAIERDMRISYIMHAVANSENLEAGEKDLEAEIEKAVSRAATDEERLKTRQFFEARRNDIIATLTEHKVEDFLRKNAIVTEAK